MKILAIGDFHGKIAAKLKRKIKKLDYDVVLCTGDLPYTDKIRKIEWKHMEELKKGKGWKEILTKKEYGKLLHYFRETIKSVQRIINFLALLKKPTYLISGNSDFSRYEARYFNLVSLEKRLKKKKLKLLYKKVISLNYYNLAGLSGYRFPVFKDFRKDIKGITKKKINGFNRKWDKKLKRLFLKAKNRPIIFLVHDPPKRCLDLVKNKKSDLYKKHIGDDYFNKYIKKYQPLLVICGHMHENQGSCKIGKTTIINTGAAYEGKAALIELEEERIKSVKFLR